MSWKPTATLEALQVRAKLYRYIRDFFSQRQFIEVDVPLLSRAGSTDPHLHSWLAKPAEVGFTFDPFYLQTSPEFFMKRLLAAGSGPIYALTKAFRHGECGRYHNPEFTMLEWYQPGFDDQQLMRQVAELITGLLDVEVHSYQYQELFEKYCELNPHTANAEQLAECANKYFSPAWGTASCDVWLDAIFSHVIQPQLPLGLVFVYDYPACQAALAKIVVNEKGVGAAKRFEAFLNRIELVNGYWELTDAEEQLQRFNNDNITRRSLDLPEVASDSRLIDALRAGLPEMAGVALGVDRLLMALTGAKSIDEVMAFPFARV